MPKNKKKKRSLLQVINPFDKESQDRRLMRKGRKAGKKAARDLKGPNVGIGVSGETPKAHAKAIKKTQRKRKIQELTPGGRRKKIGASKGTKVRTKAKSLQKTKGGEYVKYEKGSKSAGKFKTAFKSGCAGGAKSFKWDGRSYSCAKK